MFTFFNYIFTSIPFLSSSNLKSQYQMDTESETDNEEFPDVGLNELLDDLTIHDDGPDGEVVG